MLTRRGFSNFAACAMCGITEFIATEASAQGTQPAATLTSFADVFLLRPADAFLLRR